MQTIVHVTSIRTHTKPRYRAHALDFSRMHVGAVTSSKMALEEFTTEKMGNVIGKKEGWLDRGMLVILMKTMTSTTMTTKMITMTQTTKMTMTEERW